MMDPFVLSRASLEQLETCHDDLQRLVKTVSLARPIVVIEGFRGQDKQHADFLAGRSKLDWPNGKHNKNPSIAVDIAPLPYNPDDTQSLIYFAGFVMGVASQLGIKVRSGADWSRNFLVSDEKFKDLFHFELITT